MSLSPAIAQSIDPSDFVIRRSTYQPPTLMTNVSVGSDGSPGTQRILTRVESRDDMAGDVLAAYSNPQSLPSQCFRATADSLLS